MIDLSIFPPQNVEFWEWFCDYKFSLRPKDGGNKIGDFLRFTIENHLEYVFINYASKGQKYSENVAILYRI